MTQIIDHGRPPPEERTAGRGIVIAGDRTKSFRVAKRHSNRVRTLRFVLPLAAFGIMGVYGFTLLKVTDFGSSAAGNPDPRHPARKPHHG